MLVSCYSCQSFDQRSEQLLMALQGKQVPQGNIWSFPHYLYIVDYTRGLIVNVEAFLELMN